MPLVYGQDERVATWVAARNGHSEAPPVSATIGFERGGDLVAGATFDNCSKTNVFVHVACSALMMPVEFVAAIARYAFVQLGAKRMTFLVYDTNTECRAFVLGLGAVKEGAIKEGHEKGDVIVYALWREGNALFDRLLRTGRIEAVKETT